MELQHIAHWDALHTESLTDDTHITIHPGLDIPMRTIRQAAATLQAQLGVTLALPLSYAAYVATTELSALAPMFPLIRALDSAGRHSWMQHFRALMHDSRLSITWTTASTQTAPHGLRAVIVGHIVSCFVQRPDILTALLQTRPIFALFRDQRAYESAGGVSGGCYVEQTHTIMLVASRLFEGYWQPIPGVCPLLHEFGHMLDGTHRRYNRLPACTGELPLLQPTAPQTWQSALRQTKSRATAPMHATPTRPAPHRSGTHTCSRPTASFWQGIGRCSGATRMHSRRTPQRCLRFCVRTSHTTHGLTRLILMGMSGAIRRFMHKKSRHGPAPSGFLPTHPDYTALSRGKVNVNVAPRPNPSLWAVNVPPCASQIARAMVSPTPLPPVARARDGSTR